MHPALRLHRRVSEPLLDQNLVDILPIDLRLPLRVADDDKALTEICLQRRGIVGTDEREDLFVTLPARGLERDGKQAARDALTPQREIDVGTEDADVIERSRVGRVRLEHLKADDRAVWLAHGHFPDPAILKVDDVVELSLDADRRVEHRVAPRLDNRVQHLHEPRRIRGLDVTDEDLHPIVSGAGRRILLDRA